MDLSDIENIKSQISEGNRIARARNNGSEFIRHYKNLREALGFMVEKKRLEIRWAGPCLRDKKQVTTKSLSIFIHSDYSTTIKIVR